LGWLTEIPEAPSKLTAPPPDFNSIGSSRRAKAKYCTSYFSASLSKTVVRATSTASWANCSRPYPLIVARISASIVPSSPTASPAALATAKRSSSLENGPAGSCMLCDASNTTARIGFLLISSVNRSTGLARTRISIPSTKTRVAVKAMRKLRRTVARLLRWRV